MGTERVVYSNENNATRTQQAFAPEIEEMLINQAQIISNLENRVDTVENRLSRIVKNVPSDLSPKQLTVASTQIGIEMESNNAKLQSLVSRLQYVIENLGI